MESGAGTTSSSSGTCARWPAPLWPQLPAGVCPLFYPLRVKDKDAVSPRCGPRASTASTSGATSTRRAIRRSSRRPPSCGETVIEIPCHQDRRRSSRRWPTGSGSRCGCCNGERAEVGMIRELEVGGPEGASWTRIEAVRGGGALASLRGEWDALLDRSAAARSFNSWEWLPLVPPHRARARAVRPHRAGSRGAAVRPAAAGARAAGGAGAGGAAARVPRRGPRRRRLPGRDRRARPGGGGGGRLRRGPEGAARRVGSPRPQ